MVVFWSDWKPRVFQNLWYTWSLFWVEVNHSDKKVFEFLQLFLGLVKCEFLDPGLMLFPEIIVVLLEDELVDFIILGWVLERKTT